MATSLLSEEDLTRFRTKPCRRSKREGCDFGSDRCQYSHNTFWPRRCPFYLSDPNALRYLPDLCPNVEIIEDGKVRNACGRGGYCPFAHSNEEILYHPLFYKTRICSSFQKGDCDVYYCPNIHGLAEERPMKEYTLPYTRGINVPYYPNVRIVDKPGSNFKSSLTKTSKFKSGLNLHKQEPQEFSKSSMMPSTAVRANSVLTNQNTDENCSDDKKNYSFSSQKSNDWNIDNSTLFKNTNENVNANVPLHFGSGLQRYESFNHLRNEKNMPWDISNNIFMPVTAKMDLGLEKDCYTPTSLISEKHQLWASKLLSPCVGAKDASCPNYAENVDSHMRCHPVLGNCDFSLASKGSANSLTSFDDSFALGKKPVGRHFADNLIGSGNRNVDKAFFLIQFFSVLLKDPICCVPKSCLQDVNYWREVARRICILIGEDYRYYAEFMEKELIKTAKQFNKDDSFHLDHLGHRFFNNLSNSFLSYLNSSSSNSESGLEINHNIISKKISRISVDDIHGSTNSVNVAEVSVQPQVGSVSPKYKSNSVIESPSHSSSTRVSVDINWERPESKIV